MAKANSSTQMVIYMKASGLMTKPMELDAISTRTVQYMRENGSKISSTVWAKKSGLMVLVTKVSLLMGARKVRVP